MNKKLLKEELKRFNSIINYNPSNPTINEGNIDIPTEIVNELKPDLPLNKFSDKIDSILLLQKTLVSLDKDLGDSGIDGDGVDGDFGSKTEKALYNLIKDKELNNTNISKFNKVLKDNESKISDVLTNFDVFINKYKENYGVTTDMLEACKTGAGTKGRKGSDAFYPNLDYVVKKKTCVSYENMAKSINKLFPELDIVSKSSILATMINEQGGGGYICGGNYNFAGIQTDSGNWGKLDEKIAALFCSKDKDGIRSFASFNNVDDGVSFLKYSFDKKGWFVKLLKNFDVNKVKSGEFDLEKLSKENAEFWQRNWNLSLDDEEFEDFKNNGYNSKLKNQNFTHGGGIYKSSVENLSPEERKIHNEHISTYWSPKKIETNLNSASKIFKIAFNVFKDVKGKLDSKTIYQNNLDNLSSKEIEDHSRENLRNKRNVERYGGTY